MRRGSRGSGGSGRGGRCAACAALARRLVPWSAMTVTRRPWQRVSPATNPPLETTCTMRLGAPCASAARALLETAARRRPPSPPGWCAATRLAARARERGPLRRPLSPTLPCLRRPCCRRRRRQFPISNARSANIDLRGWTRRCRCSCKSTAPRTVWNYADDLQPTGLVGSGRSICPNRVEGGASFRPSSMPPPPSLTILQPSVRGEQHPRRRRGCSAAAARQARPARAGGRAEGSERPAHTRTGRVRLRGLPGRAGAGLDSDARGGPCGTRPARPRRHQSFASAVTDPLRRRPATLPL